MLGPSAPANAATVPALAYAASGLVSVDVAPTYAPANIVPTPQGNAYTILADVVPRSRSIDYFSASIDKLFGNIGGGIGGEVIEAP
ncbi:unnamed protein product [Ilex paraguariensis]|uniref:Uncharacterized protein n=1 Tax=Ilex paraguariensis TaxID=185542 RepID=A0ABC8RAF5_9AQUA